MNNIKEIKKEFEEKFLINIKFGGFPYKGLWSFIESTISQTKQELIEEIKKSLPTHSDGIISRNEVKKILDRI